MKHIFITIALLLAIVFPVISQAEQTKCPCAPTLSYQFRGLETERLTMDVTYTGCKPDLELWMIRATYKDGNRPGLYVDSSVLVGLNPVEILHVRAMINQTVRVNVGLVNKRRVMLFWPAKLVTSTGFVLE